MSTLRFLLLEDKPQDTEAIQAALTDGGIDYELLWVDTRADFVRALETQVFDLILAAYVMPGCDGIAALEIACKLCPDMPFIFVSASLGEEPAIEALKRGATDYVLKQRLERLVPCVQRALQEAQERRDRKQAEQERGRFLDIGSDLQVITGINGYFQWVSPTFERTLGWTVDEMTSRPWTDFIHSDDVPESVSETDSLFSGNETFAFENRYRHKDGSYRWLLWRAKPYPEEQVIYGVAVDITEAKRVEDERQQAEAALRESENRLRLALESTELGTWDFNPTTGVLQWDDQCKAMFGLSPEAEINYDVFLAGLHPEDRDRINQVVQFSLNPDSGGEYDIEYRTVGIEDGVERWIAAKGKAFFNLAGVAIRFIGTVLNITEKKRAEAEREQLLQREQVAREEAERANRLKDEFLAVLSHELRSPLNPILGWSKLLQDGKLDETRRSEALKTIERNAKLQSQLIEDLLDISRIMQGKLSLTVAPVSLTFVISAALETVRLAAAAKNIQITLDFDPAFSAERNSAGTAPISGDAARLQQVVWNLLSNAVKFTPVGGHVEVRLEQVEAVGDREVREARGADQSSVPSSSSSPFRPSPSSSYAQISVTDTGKGIQPQFLPHVFEYFRQEDGSTTRQFGGLGLGLAIARQIVEMHGGTIWAKSKGENLGATFIVQLPAGQRAVSIVSESARTQAETEAPLDKIQILLVDDDTDTREFQTFLLEQNGAKVIAVASGLEALQALEQFIPDVIVSDIGMAEMDGYMLIQQIRSRSTIQGQTIPAIALSAYASELDQQRALQAGFQMHISKPVEPEKLVSGIVNLLAHN